MSLEDLQIKDEPLGDCDRSEDRRNASMKREWKVIIPESWLMEACKLPAKCVSVAIALWWLVGRRQSDTVIFSNDVAMRFNVSRKAKWVGLTLLEKANLISVNRRGRGRAPGVTILRA